MQTPYLMNVGDTCKPELQNARKGLPSVEQARAAGDAEGRG